MDYFWRDKEGIIADEKYSIVVQIWMHEKIFENFLIFLLTLCVTYVTIVNVTDVIVRRLI